MVTQETLQPTAIYTTAEVARLVFRHSVEWFYENHAKLRDEHGFPDPVSPIGRPRWSGAQLIAWTNRVPNALATVDNTMWSNVLDLRTERMRRKA